MPRFQFRFRALILIAAAAALGACSDAANGPTAPTQQPAAATARQQQDVQQQQQPQSQAQAPVAEQGTVGKRQGSLLGAESVRTENWARVCNRLRTECATFYWSGNVIYRVFSQGAAQGPGCSRDVFTVNGILIARSGLVCHGRGDVLWWDLRLRLRVPYGALLKTDWRGSIYSPPGYVAVRF